MQLKNLNNVIFYKTQYVRKKKSSDPAETRPSLFGQYIMCYYHIKHLG